MAVLDNTQHERFAQAIAKGKTQTDAYLAAGYKTTTKAAKANAARLIANDAVKARINEIKAKAAAFAERGEKPAPVGRPSKYDPKYCEGIEDFMRKGFSATAYAGYIGVCRDTISEWCNVYPEFSASMERGKAKRGLEWEIMALKSAKENKGSAQMIKFGLMNVAPEDWSATIQKPGSESEGGNGDTYIFQGGFPD